MSLKQKTIQGVAWSFSSQVGKQVSQFVITAILARLLSPQDFGLVGMATVFTGFIAIFSDMSLGNALIQRQNIDDRHLSSAFWLNVMIGFGIALFFVLVSPLIALFYDKPELTPVLMALSLNFILASFTVVQQAVLSKKMDFRSLMIRDIAAVVLSGAVGIVAAYRGAGVWSLVYQMLAFTLLNGVLLFSLSKWKPKFIFSTAAIREIFSYSAYMTGFNVFNYLARNVDYLLIGKFLGAGPLGFYTLAYKLMLYPLHNISWTVNKVMFAAFSKIQADIEKVAVNYLKVVQSIALVTFPMMAGLFVLAPEFIFIVYGEKWMPVVPVIRILCLCGLAQSVGTTVGTIYQSLGKAGFQFRMAVANTTLAIIAIAIGLQWGIVGVAACYSIFAFLWTHFSLFVVSRIIGVPYFRLYSRFFKPFAASAVMVAFTAFLKTYLPETNTAVFIATVAASASVYGAMLFALRQIVRKGGKWEIAY